MITLSDVIPTNSLWLFAAPNSLDAVICTTAAGTILEFNGAAERKLHIARSEAIGRSFAEVVLPPKDRERLQSEIFLASSPDRRLLSNRLEITGQKNNGQTFPAEVLVTPIPGDRTLLQISIRDITARKKVEEAAVWLAAIVECSNDAIIGSDLDGTIISWNRAAELLYGHSREEAIGKSIQLIVPPEFEGERLGLLEQLRKGKKIETFETMRLGKGGALIPVELTLTPVTDPDGCILGAASMTRDITERHLQQEALRRANETSIYACPISILSIDLDEKISLWNAAAERVFDWKDEEVIGQCDPTIDPSDPAPSQEFYRRLLAGETVTGVEVVRQKKDGSKVKMALSGSPLKTEEGSIRGAVAFLIDVTLHRELEGQVRQMQKMEAVGQLAGGVAHDFNNILMAISSYGSLLSLKLKDNEDTHQYVEEVLAATDRGAALTQRLLAFSRKQVLESRVLDLNQVIEAQIGMLRRLLPENIKLHFRGDTNLGQTKVDHSQIEQVILNMLVNARDAMPLGGEITIETFNAILDGKSEKAGTMSKAYVAFSIRDNGTGMDPETMARIYEPFFTTKPTGKGTGLGLATAFGIVKQSEGHIFVESEKGVGTTFRVYLPRVAGKVEVIATENLSEPLGGSERILLVEDEESVRTSTAEYLVTKGYNVLTASDGVEGLKVALEQPGKIDLLVTDVVMPGISGAELVDAYRLLYPKTPIIFMSAYSDNLLQQYKDVVKSGDLISKPFRLPVLGRKIREKLDALST